MASSPHNIPGISADAPGLEALVSLALQHHQAGRLTEAEVLYRGILQVVPQHTDSLHLLGVLAHQVGRPEVAVQLIGKAIAIDPGHASFHSNLGSALQALGRLEDAVGSYRRALMIDPAFIQAEQNLGVALQAMGELDEAESCLRQAVEKRPDLPEGWINLGNLLQMRGQREEALRSQQKALLLRPESAEAEYNLGNLHMSQGQNEEAKNHFQRAIALRPNLAEAHANLGNLLLSEANPEEAAKCYEEALRLNPAFAVASFNLGNAREAQGRMEEALACFDRALELNPQLAPAHYNRASLLFTTQRYEEAEAGFRVAMQIDPQYAKAHYNLGCALQEQGRHTDAIAAIRQALAVQPEYPQAAFALALALLRVGNLAEGWKQAEIRWQSEDHETRWRDFATPIWKGEKLKKGRVLLWGEQGIGDEVQFASLIPDALKSGNSIVLDCDPRLRPLFERSFPAVKVVSGLTPEKPGRLAIGAHLPTGSLPLLYRNTEMEFAAQQSPYLVADAERVKLLRKRYGKGLKVGLSWKSRNQKSGEKRSLSLSALKDFFAMEGVRWVSLQYGVFDELESEIRSSGAKLKLDREIDSLADIDGFAAQVAAMDVVVSIDNSTVHLAGALGRPTLAMLPFVADWRWMQDRADTPWYSSVRLIRQPEAGAWQPVLAEVVEALHQKRGR